MNDKHAEVVPGRVFISYAHDSDEHEKRVQAFWLLLRSHGIDAKLDLPAAARRQDWPLWMARQVREAEFIIVIASPAYRRRAEGDAAADEGRGVQYEAALLRELVYRDRDGSLDIILPVVLPECNVADLPIWLNPVSTTRYVVADLTVEGAEQLLRTLVGQPSVVEPPLGRRISFPTPGTAADTETALSRHTLSTLVEVALSITSGELVSTVSIAETPVASHRHPLPRSAHNVWQALSLNASTAESQLGSAGNDLARAVFDEDVRQLLGNLADSLVPGSHLEVRFDCDQATQNLPLELIRLTGRQGIDLGPIALQPGLSVYRTLQGHHVAAAQPSAGPIKVLVAVAAPDETKTANSPLDVEAEMQAVLEATRSLAEQATAEVQILEVASLEQITSALRDQEFHVLHLSAHGGPAGVELEDEDGYPVPVTARDLMGALRDSGRAVPLIVLSSCAGAAAGREGGDGLAQALIRSGADRVIAMQARVTDHYATELAAAFYTELATRTQQPVAAALATARRNSERHRQQRARAAEEGTATRHPELPEYAVATVFAASADLSLIDGGLPQQPLAHPTPMPTGTSVRELPIGRLIGRRPQLRRATAILRRTPQAVEKYGAVAGVVLTGTGGIGKTALAGRLIGRLRGDGWPVATHVGAWDPTQLLIATAAALETSGLDSDTVAILRNPAIDDTAKFECLLRLVADTRMLLVFDDFEQNLAPGGQWLDSTVEGLFTRIADSAMGSSLLVTSRYPLSGLEGLLANIPLPPLSPAELGRMLLRLPALRDLRGEDRAAVLRTVGGHPRLIEFLDALMRSGKTSLRDTGMKLRDLARANNLDLSRPRPLDQALDETILLGSADILLEELMARLTSSQHDMLLQLTTCRTATSTEDLAFALQANPAADFAPEDHTEITEDLISATLLDAHQLANLTLFIPQERMGMENYSWAMHPWVADAVGNGLDLSPQHERAGTMHLRRFTRQQASRSDLIEISRHLTALRQYDEAAAIAAKIAPKFSGSLAAAAYLAEVRSLIPVDQRAAMVLAGIELQAVLATGNLPAASRLAESSLEQAIRRASTDPTNTEWQRDLSVSHEKLGDLAVTTGNITAAAYHHNAALTIAQRLAATDPTNTEWQRDLSVTHNRLGDLAITTGNTTAAITHYHAALAIVQRLAATDPTNTEWQRDLSVTHNKLGNLAITTGDTDTAATHYNADLAIAQRLAATDPTNTGWQRDLSVTHNRLGDLAITTGDTDTAATHYNADLVIAQRLAATDPTNTEWQRDLSVSHIKVGDLAITTGDTDTAATHYNAGLHIRQRLAATDPTNTEWQRDLSVSHDKIADLAITTGDTDTAATHYNAGLHIRQRLAATDPTNTEWQRDLAVSHNKLGDLAITTGDTTTTGGTTTAATHYNTALAIAQRLATTDPTNTEWQRDLSVSHNKLGDLAITTGDTTTAATHYNTALAIAQRLATTDPTNTEWQRDLAVSHNKLGDLAITTGDTTTAATHYNTALAIAQRLATTDPTNTRWQRDLSITRMNIERLSHRGMRTSAKPRARWSRFKRWFARS